jgi:hypothetical protein
MFHGHTGRFLRNACIAAGIICCLFLGFGGTARQNYAADPQLPRQGRISVPLGAKQLDPINGVVPLYLKCEEALLIVPDTLERIPCTIKNNSGKRIRALVLVESVASDDNGTTSTELKYLTIDNFIHPDLHTDSKKEGIDEDAEPQFPSVSENYDGIITRVQVHIDYVEFIDKGTLGPNKAGERILEGMRQGASKYKSWLEKEYEIHGKSVASLMRLIEDESPSAADLGVESASQEQGALIYRKWLQKTYQTKGIEEVRKHLTATGAAVSQ